MTFSAPELIRVIKACRQCGVAELKIGDIYVKFGDDDTPTSQKEAKAVVPFTDAEFKEIQDKANIQENINDVEDRLELLQIDDPSTYERLILERELEEIGNPIEATEH